jgi:plastocyanin
MFRIGGHVFGLTVLGLLAACGSDDGAAPTPSDLVLEKAPSNSGDKQVGVAAEPLPQDLRARVTRNGEPVEGVTVYWSTRQGSMNPPVDVTDAEGISSSRWTTKFVYVEQEAFANLEPDTIPHVVGSLLPGMIMYTAIAAPDPEAPNAVRVLDQGGNRFEPASITVSVGDTVNWVWQVGSVAHNVVPDDGNAPGTSGAPTPYPKFLSFRFMEPGVYHYHCSVHGGPGGVGMSGSVTVLPAGPKD